MKLTLCPAAALAALLFLAGCHQEKAPASSAELSAVSDSRTSLSAQGQTDPVQLLQEQVRTLPAESAVDRGLLEPDQMRSFFYSSALDPAMIDAIDKDFYDSAQTFISPEQLRLVRLLYTDFDGQTRVGELICHELIAQDVENIFFELYQIGYPIGRVVLPYGYGANDEAVMTDNITRSLAFTWLDGTPDEHEHSLGLAIDFNSLYNPQVITENGQYIVLPSAALPYADRSVLQPHMMDASDPAVQIFQKYGFTWGGVWNQRNDYQYFEKYFNHETGHADPSVFYTQ